MRTTSKELPQQANHKWASRRLVLILSGGIFASEIVVMLVINMFAPHSRWSQAMLDSTLLSIVIVPLVYFFVHRQVQAQLAESQQAQAAQRTSENRYRTLFEGSSDAIMILEPPSWKFTSGNPATLAVFGLKNETHLVTLGPWDLSPKRQPDGRASAAKAREMIEMALRAGSHFFEWTHQRSNGQAFLASVRLSRMEAAGTVFLQASIRDISEHRHNELALRRSEERYRALAASANEAIITADATGTIVGWNQGAERAFGYTEAEAQGQPLTVLMSPGFRSQHIDGMRRVTARAAPHATGKTVELEGLRKDGSTFPLELSLAEWETDEGYFHTGIIRDITARQQATAVLRLREAALQAAANVIVMTDRQGNIIWVNAAFTRMTGYTAEEALGGNPRVLKSGQHDDGFYRNLWETIQAGHVWQGEIINKRKDGSLFTEEATITPVRDATGNISHFIAVKQDITERKLSEMLLKQTTVTLSETNVQLEVSIARANQLALQAELANCAKSEFLATMSHEIRTPMNGVLGMVGLLLDSDLTREQRQFAELAQSSGNALMTVINDILDFAKIEAHKLDLETLDFDLRTTLEETANLLAVRAQAKGLELTCLIAPGLPLLLRGDPGRLRQILMNLAGNAVKFTSQGEVAIRADLETEAEGTVTLRFTVTDTGIGIPPSRIEALFAPFVQVDSSTTREYGGTGLGLAISKQLVELMGGRIGVASVAGAGSTFWFTASLAKQPVPGAPALEPAACLAGVNVLVVDDNATSRLVMATHLRAWGCRCTEAGGGESALTTLRAAAQAGDPFQIALLDAQMPGMDGEELARRTKQDPELPPTTLILLTLLGQLRKTDPATALRFAGFLPKPVQQIPLRNLMVRALVPTLPSSPPPVELETTPIMPPRSSQAITHRSPIRILLAEDNPTNQTVALAVLQRLGYHADAVANGLEVIAALQRMPYDLVLMDCEMPELDGYEATRRIRQPGSGVLNPLIPVIAMTAHALQGARDKCLRAGMNDYMSKPIEKGRLASALQHWLPPPEEPAAEHLPAFDVPASGSPPAASMVIFNPAGLLDRLQGDAGMARTILAGFLGDIPKQLRLLADYLEQDAAAEVTRQAHTIKGAAATVGAPALEALAFEVEQAGQQGELTRAASLLPSLVEQFTQLEDTLKQAGWAPSPNQSRINQ